MIASTARLCGHAREHGYAVAAVNIVDDLSLRAAIAAAVERSAPLIVQVSVKTVRSIGVELMTTMFRLAATDVPVPVALHLDHCADRDVITAVVAAGWSSVLFDASDRPLDQAEAETAAVVRQAHAAGCDVESEIENIVGVEDDIGSDDEAVHAYSVRTLVEVAERTGTDLIAPQLGTAHGLYTRTPVLLPERVRELTLLTDRPVVLHGGTGLSDRDFRTFIDAGVAKINISTGLKLAYMKAAQAATARAEETGKWDPPTMFRAIHDAVEAEVTGRLDAFRSTGQAAAAALVATSR